jgi:hypothetical protein
MIMLIGSKKMKGNMMNPNQTSNELAMIVAILKDMNSKRK